MTENCSSIGPCVDHFSGNLPPTTVRETVHLSTYVSQVSSKLPLVKAQLMNLETLPKVNIAHRLYLTLPVANAKGERSFSVPY